MIVASPALPTAVPDPATASSASTTGSPDASSNSDFASLLSASSGANPTPGKSNDKGTALGQKTTTSGNPDTEEESSDESVPTPAEQMNLAALLYAPQMAPPVTPPVTVPEAVGVSNPAQASTAFSLSGQSLPLNYLAQDEQGESSNPVLANVELPTATEAAPASFPVPPTAAPTTNEVKAPTADLPLPPRTEDAAPAPVMTAPAQQASTPSLPVSEVVAQVASGTLPLDPAIAASLPKTEKAPAAETAPATVPETDNAENLPAISAAGTLSEAAVPAKSEKPASTANTDAHLISEQPIAQQTPRGTGSAKAVREMKSSTVTQPDSSTESTPRAITAEKGARGDTPGEQQQNSSSPDNPATSRSGADGFSVTTSAHTTKSEAIAKPTENVPMTPTAVVKELTNGVERIQQSGHDRMDLRLTLEGGGEVSIALQVRDGAVHASFQTNSPEMREALQKGWSQMAARTESLSIPLAEPVFKSSTNTSGNSFQQQDPRERRQEPSQEQGHHQRAAFFQNGTTQPSKRGAVASMAAPVRRASSGLNLYA